MTEFQSQLWRMCTWALVQALWTSLVVQTLGVPQRLIHPLLGITCKRVTPTQFLRLCFLLIVCLIRKWVSIYRESRTQSCGDETFSNCAVRLCDDCTFCVWGWQVLFSCCCLRRSPPIPHSPQLTFQAEQKEIQWQESQTQSSYPSNSGDLCSFIIRCVGKGLCVANRVSFTAQEWSESKLDR